MAGTRRRYTKQQKAAAVGLALTINPQAAAEQTGIPRTTLLQWMDKPEYDDLRRKTRDEMADGFKVLANLALSRLTKQIADDEVDPKDVAVAMGVATEKYLLLMGDATTRTEHRSLIDGLDDHETDALRAAIDSELARRTDEQAAGAASDPTVGEASETGAAST